MAPTKRALLIGSPFGNLVGPEDDVERMAGLLKAEGFQIAKCCGSHATRDGIRAAWKQLITDISPARKEEKDDEDEDNNDVVVIYYSGHGGEVVLGGGGNAVDRQQQPQRQPPPQQQYRHQFIVPMDFAAFDDDTNDFRGILDVELSNLLWRTTAATHNVTVVLDCCHSGGMARDPHHGAGAVPKNIPRVTRLDVAAYTERLRREGHVLSLASLEAGAEAAEKEEKGEDNQEKKSPMTMDLADGNPHVVRILAAAPSETAWEYENAAGRRVGVLTEALVDSLRAVLGGSGQEQGQGKGQRVQASRTIPWRTIMLRVKELVSVKFPQQHPQADGRSNRLPFSLREAGSSATGERLVIKREVDGRTCIQAGRVVGIREGSTYVVMPFGSSLPALSSSKEEEEAKENLQIAKATVTHVSGFRAEVRLEFMEKYSATGLPVEGALAFPSGLPLYRWPAEVVVVPEAQWANDRRGWELRERLARSHFLRVLGDDGDEGDETSSSTALVQFEQQRGVITLLNDRGVRIALCKFQGAEPLPCTVAAALTSGEMLARAQHFLNLMGERQPREKLAHGLRVELKLVEVVKNNNNNNGNKNESSGSIVHRGRVIKQDGTDAIEENSLIYITLHNSSNDYLARVFASVFNVQVNGKISLVSTPSEPGVELMAGEHYMPGLRAADGVLGGLSVSWPEGVPRDGPVEETLVVVVTDARADLRNFESWRALEGGGGEGKGRSSSSLESLAYALAYGTERKIQAETAEDVHVHYDVIYIPFLLRPASNTATATTKTADTSKTGPYISAADLPGPDWTPEWKRLTSRISHGQPKMRSGLFSAISNVVRRVPPCVWVVNEHTEEITVVVSKFRPGRMLSGAGVNASTTGAGVDFSTTTYLAPAVKKILGPCDGGRDSLTNKACFPFWTRRDSFGVISIFVGPQKTSYIENDKVRVGVTAYFENRPDLRMVEYRSRCQGQE